MDKLRQCELLYNNQKKNNIPAPQEDEGFGFLCPVCKKQIGGEIVLQVKKGSYYKECCLWECICGYKFIEIEEGEELMNIDVFTDGSFECHKS